MKIRLFIVSLVLALLLVACREPAPYLVVNTNNANIVVKAGELTDEYVFSIQAKNLPDGGNLTWMVGNPKPCGVDGISLISIPEGNLIYGQGSSLVDVEVTNLVPTGTYKCVASFVIYGQETGGTTADFTIEVK